MNPRIVPHLIVERSNDDAFDTSAYEGITQDHDCENYRCRHFHFDAEGTPFEVVVRDRETTILQLPSQLELRRGHHPFEDCRYLVHWPSLHRPLGALHTRTETSAPLRSPSPDHDFLEFMPSIL